MASPIHCLQIPTVKSNYRIEPTTDGVYFATPITKYEVGIWSFQNLQSSPLVLTGHRQVITSLCFSFGTTPKLICTCASDYVIVWNVHRTREQFAKGETVRGEIIGTTIGEVIHCCFNRDDSCVAACIDSNVLILNATRQVIIAELKGHQSRVTKAEFCPHYSATLVTISDDRTFKIWDVQSFSLVYDSPIITSSSLISIAMSWSSPYVSIGSSDGIIRTFDLTDGNNFRGLNQIDVTKAVAKCREQTAKSKKLEDKDKTVTISKRGTWKKVDSEENISEQGQAILFMKYCLHPVKSKENAIAPQHAATSANNILQSSPETLVVITTGSIIQFNGRTLETIDFIDMHKPIQSLHPECTDYIVNAAETASIGQSSETSVLWVMLGTMFKQEVHVVQLGLVDPNFENVVSKDSDISYIISAVNFLNCEDDSTSGLNMVAVTPLHEKSPLNSEYIAPSTSKVNVSTNSISKKIPAKKATNTMNQPLTFKSKVKSSGYTQAPRMTMFKPKINKVKSLETKNKTFSKFNPLGNDYPTDGDPPVEIQNVIDVAEQPTVINQVVFSDNGQSVACVSANKTAALYKIPISHKASRVYVGHTGNVNSVAWAHDSKMVVTASDDKTVAIWVGSSSEPILKFENILNNLPVSKEQPQKTKANLSYSKEIKSAQFFYMDKFVLLSSGNTLYLYKYFLDPDKDEIKRYLTKSRYKLVQSWTIPSLNITSMTAVNAFHSHIVLCSGSNRDLNVFDLNQGLMATTFTDSHARPVHSLCINKGSSFASQPCSAYNLFASAAASDCIKLWDLRSQRCVQRLEGHLNKAHTCGMAVSPCGKYLASGSEDRLVYMFDLRTGTYCERLRGNSDVVTDVTFHPEHPMLISGSLDGKIVSYLPE